jgi:hypothetical protein
VTLAGTADFQGVDQVKDHHEAVILDRAGNTVAAFTFAHTAEGGAQWRECIKPFAALGVVLETGHGVAVEQLLASGVTVYALRCAQFPHPTPADVVGLRSLGLKDNVEDW